MMKAIEMLSSFYKSSREDRSDGEYHRDFLKVIELKGNLQIMPEKMDMVNEISKINSQTLSS